MVGVGACAPIGRNSDDARRARKVGPRTAVVSPAQRRPSTKRCRSPRERTPRMTRRRWLALAVSIGSVFALAAPAAQAAQNTTVTFAGVGAVDVQDLGPGSNTVRFTMHDVVSPDTTRLFIDPHG